MSGGGDGDEQVEALKNVARESIKATDNSEFSLTPLYADHRFLPARVAMLAMLAY